MTHHRFHKITDRDARISFLFTIKQYQSIMKIINMKAYYYSLHYGGGSVE